MSDKELDELSKDEAVVYCYIKKGDYYYRPQGRGYTERVVSAGVYEKEGAIHHAKSCRELWLVPIRDIKAHNEALRAEIKSMELNIISL